MTRFVFRLLFLLCFSLTKSVANSLPVLPNGTQDSLQTLLSQSKPDTNRVNLLVKLGYFYLYKPGETASDLDNTLLFCRKAASLSQSLHFIKGEGKSYLLASMAYHEKGNLPPANTYAQKAIKLFAKYNLMREAGEACVTQSRYYSLSKEDLPEKIRLNEQALSFYQKTGDKLGQAHILKVLGDLYQVGDQYGPALVQLQKALAIYKSLKHPNLYEVYDLLGTVSYEMDNYEAALKYGLLAVKLAESAQDTSMLMCTIYNRLGSTLFGLNQTEKAKGYFSKSLLIARKYNDKEAFLTVTINYCNLLQKVNQTNEALTLLQSVPNDYIKGNINIQAALAGRFLLIHKKLKQYNLAQQYCDQLLTLISTKKIQPKQQVRSYDNLISFFLDSKQYHLAGKYLVINDSLCQQQNLKNYLYRNNLNWFKLDSTQGNYKKAITHYQKYKVLRDSIFNETKSKQIAQLQVLYETEKKDQDLKLKQQNIALLTKQNQVQQAVIRQKDFQRNSFIVGTTMLLLLSGMMYNRYRLKQQSHRNLQAKQAEINQKNASLQQVLLEKEELLEEKEWMMREIHHRVKNNLQIISGLLYSQSAYLQDPTALTAIRESQNRVQAMAFIHQKLYQSDSLNGVPMQAYIQEIADHLLESFNCKHTVQLQVEVSAIELEISQAVPLGLIINEAVTNSLKYAFPDGLTGKICLILQPVDNLTFRLTIADNGAGLPLNFNLDQCRTLGLNMIKGLSRQIKGDLHIGQAGGVEIRLEFAPIHSSKASPLFT